MQSKSERKYVYIIALLFVGIVLRFWAMSLGHNFDFESYCVVGDLASQFKNIYAETPRYNYGPLFLIIQGICYKLSQIISDDEILTFRILIVSVLTFTDLSISLIIADRWSWKKALIFFLNPISVLITGYHNQFDNIAVLFALISIYFYNNEEKIGRKDIFFIFFISLSLIAKHIMFVMPIFILLKSELPIKKKVLYAFIPPLTFLISFVPFVINNKLAFEGILQHVFLYKSYNNSPLLDAFWNLINFPSNCKFYVFVLLMCVVGYIARKQEFEYELLIYCIALVAFSSAIANQYLVIPLAAICILEVKWWKHFYIVAVAVFLILEGHGLGLLNWVQIFMPQMVTNICVWYVDKGYVVATWILFFMLISEVIKKKRKNL